MVPRWSWISESISYYKCKAMKMGKKRIPTVPPCGREDIPQTPKGLGLPRNRLTRGCDQANLREAREPATSGRQPASVPTLGASCLPTAEICPRVGSRPGAEMSDPWENRNQRKESICLGSHSRRQGWSLSPSWSFSATPQILVLSRGPRGDRRSSPLGATESGAEQSWGKCS